MTVYHDIDEAEGSYVSLGVGHSFADVIELGPGIPLALLSLALPFEIGGLTVTPSVNYVTLVSDEIRRTDAYGRDSDDMWYAGIGFAKEF
ncbi:MAG: hypothetical protein ACYTEK_28850 [Planctomycetota bacterium]